METTGLNQFAASFAKRFVGARDIFGENTRVLDGGHFECAVLAPEGVRCAALILQTAGTDEIWLRIAPPATGYLADDIADAIQIVDEFLAGRLVWVVEETDGEWSGTTLARRPFEPTPDAAHTVRLYSWSGRHDLDVAG